MCQTIRNIDRICYPLLAPLIIIKPLCFRKKKAREKNIYAKLTHGDILDYLLKEDLDFDYFISTDTFVYLGDLSDVFRLLKSRNKSGHQAISGPWWSPQIKCIFAKCNR